LSGEIDVTFAGHGKEEQSAQFSTANKEDQPDKDTKRIRKEGAG